MSKSVHACNGQMNIFDFLHDNQEWIIVTSYSRDGEYRYTGYFMGINNECRFLERGCIGPMPFAIYHHGYLYGAHVYDDYDEAVKVADYLRMCEVNVDDTHHFECKVFNKSILPYSPPNVSIDEFTNLLNR